MIYNSNINKENFSNSNSVAKRHQFNDYQGDQGNDRIQEQYSNDVSTNAFKLILLILFNWIVSALFLEIANQSVYDLSIIACESHAIPFSLLQ